MDEGVMTVAGNDSSAVAVYEGILPAADGPGIQYVLSVEMCIRDRHWDSPRNSAYRYETFISSELVKYTDEHYATTVLQNGKTWLGTALDLSLIHI